MRTNGKIIAIPPGSTIKEQLEDRGISQKELAVRLDISEKHLSHLINGTVQLTVEMALKLEVVFGIPAKFWLNLESIYQEKIARLNEEEELNMEIDLSKKFPYNEMSKLGWIEKTNKPQERVYNLKRFFEVTKLANLFIDKLPQAFCRRQKITKKGDYALMATEQYAKLLARSIVVEDINLNKLKKDLNYIKSLSRMRPEEFYDDLKSVLALNGIALVVIDHLTGSYLNGVTFVDNKKIVLCLTVRGKDADKFWFSLFHELGHVILGHIVANEYNTTMENEADDFARNTLISLERYEEFIRCNNFSSTAIKQFALENNISDGIVVGRLQKDNIIKYSQFNNLKKSYIVN